MSDTIREQILTAIETRLGLIRKSYGYNYDLGLGVYRAFLVPLDYDDIPAIGFLPGVETCVKHHGGSTLADWQITIQAVEKYGSVLASVAAEKLYGDVIENVFGIDWSLGFDSGGTSVVKVGDTITGADSDAEGYVSNVAVATGAWADGDAAGTLSLRRVKGTFEDDEQINIGALTNVATADGVLSGTGAEANFTAGLAESVSLVTGEVQMPSSDQDAVGVSLIISIMYKSITGNPYLQET